MEFDRFAVIVPAYNARKSLHELITRLLKFIPVANIVVVDDGSADGTAEVARQLGADVVRHAHNQGKGSALRSGFDRMKGKNDIEAVFTIDADLQHRPEDLPRFIDRLKLTGAEIIVGRRKRVGSDMPIHRRLSNALTSFLVSIRTGVPILDSQCGFRLIRRSVLSAIPLESTGFEAETELLIRAVKRGFKVDFVPIDTVYSGETSHMRSWETIRNFIKVLFRDY